jgi:2-aminoadipate transaminase
MLAQGGDTMDWEKRYAGRMGKVQPSPIMDLIRVMSRRQVINFASGLPDPARFPVKALREAAEQIFTEDWRAGLQYGEADGYRPLREWVAKDLTSRGVPTETAQVLMVSGSQQGIDLVARAFIQPGDVVLTEEPSYLAALQVFASFEADVRPIRTDEGGLDPDAAAAALKQPGVKLLYAMPNHQNPSGTTLADDRRLILLEAVAAADVPVLADEAYLHLRYDPGEPAPLAAADPEAPILTVGTFSKTIAPGLRVAWIAGPTPVINRLALLKQVTDLHANSFTQRMVHRYVSAGHLPAQVAHLRSAYREKRDMFLHALERRLAGKATWTRPAGGMFLLLRLPRGRSATALLSKALDEGIAYVPGGPFFPAGGGEETMRLNFVSPPLSDIDEGVARLARAIG